MKISPRRRRRALGITAVIAAAGLLTPAARADDGDTEPSKYDWAPGGNPTGPLPVELLNELQDCPRQEDFDIPLFVCLKIKAYDGEFKIGSTVANVTDPIEMTVAIAMVDSQPVIIPSERGGGTGPSSIKLKGGLLGIPALDDILDLDPLQLLTLSVTPQMGDVAVAGDGANFLFWTAGNDTDVTLKIPLSIGLNNVLLGNDCQINEFEISLTNGTTIPPAGIEPLRGNNGPYSATTWWENGFPPTNPFNPGGKFLVSIREGSLFVDNTFEVPGATDCGPLGTGKTLNRAGLDALNLFDTLVNSQAGLPGRVGGNHAKFTIDTLLANYSSMALGGNWFWESLAALDGI